MNILKISHVTKSFGSNKIIDDLSFEVPQNCIFGFIGKNGAGKTTTMKMILGLLKADSGDIFVNNEKVTFGQNTTNRYIGYLPDVPEFYGFMTPKEYLKMCGQITGMQTQDIKNRTDELLELVGLKDADKRIHGFSRGMKQRLGIAQALLNRPKLLICDEPTSALDPVGRKEILDILYAAKEHTTVIFSTHILSDVERICDRIAFLDQGKIALTGTLDEIKSARKGDSIEIEFVKKEDAVKFAKEYESMSAKEYESMFASGHESRGSASVTGENKVLLTKRSESDMTKIMRYLIDNNMMVQRIEKLEPTLEDLFLEVSSR